MGWSRERELSESYYDFNLPSITKSPSRGINCNEGDNAFHSQKKKKQKVENNLRIPSPTKYGYWIECSLMSVSDFGTRVWLWVSPRPEGYGSSSSSWVLTWLSLSGDTLLKPFCPEAKVMDHASIIIIIIIPNCIQTRDTRMMGVAVTYSSCPC